MTFAHRGEAMRQEADAPQGRHRVLSSDGAAVPAGPSVTFVVSPARRGLVWRDLASLLPDSQVFRKRPPRADASLGRALETFADLRVGDHVVHEDHGVGKLFGFETKEVADVTRDYLFLAFRGDDRLYVPHEQIAKVSDTSARERRRPPSRSSAGRPGRTSSRGRATRCARARRRAPRPLRAAPARRRRRVRGRWRLVEALEASSPTRRPPDQAARSRRSRRISSRAQSRWIGSSAATSASGRPRWRSVLRSWSSLEASRRSCSARRQSSPSSTGRRSGSATATFPCAWR